MTRNDRDYEKLKAFADQLRKENKKLQEQITKIIFERNSNEVTKRTYETQIRDLKAAHTRELEGMRAIFERDRVDFGRRANELWAAREEISKLTQLLGRTIGQQHEPEPIKQYDGIRKLYLDD